jgi:hypothetical protein
MKLRTKLLVAYIKELEKEGKLISDRIGVDLTIAVAEDIQTLLNQPNNN